MTTRQKLELRLSEIRQKLNELSGKDELTDEERSEMNALTAEFPKVEERHRAAITAEADESEKRAAGEEAGGAGRETGEGAELRRLQRDARLSRYLAAAAGGASIDGAESELLDALEVRGHVGVQPGAVQVPLSLLLTDDDDADPERRESRTATTTTQYDGPTRQRPILQRLFGRSIVDALGVRLDSVPAGQSEWPLITAGAEPNVALEERDAPVAVAYRVAPQSLKPKRLTGRYEWTAEAAASVLGLEPALRRDLRDAVMAKMSDQLLNGTGAGATVTGFYTRLGEPADPGAQATYEVYAKTPASIVDGLHSEMEDETGVVLGTDVYRHAAGVFQAGSGESGIEAIKRRCRSCRASTYVPAGVAGISKGNLLHAAGANGGTMRGDSIAAMWPTLSVIRDIYTKAASAETVLTYVLLWDAYTAFRLAAYARVAFKLTA